MQGALARDAFGNNILPCDPKATCWCLSGAIDKCYREVNENARVWKLIEDYVGGSVPDYNDFSLTTFGQIKSMVTHLDV